MGTGNGKYLLKKAKTHPHTFYIGLDANAGNMAESSRKTARSLKKGGVENLLYIQANLESASEELYQFATQITIYFPWGSLLSAAAGQALALLQQLAKLCRDQATLHIIFSYESSIETKIMKELKLPELSKEHLRRLKDVYAQAGFSIDAHFISAAEVQKLDTTWAKKLSFGRERCFVEIKGQYSG